jgi:hypothetical protein
LLPSEAWIAPLEAFTGLWLLRENAGNPPVLPVLGDVTVQLGGFTLRRGSSSLALPLEGQGRLLDHTRAHSTRTPLEDAVQAQGLSNVPAFEVSVEYFESERALAAIAGLIEDTS